MNSKFYYVCALAFFVVALFSRFEHVESYPHSPENEVNIGPETNGKKFRNPPRKGAANRDSEVEEIEPVGEEPGAAMPPRRPGLPYFPSLNLPHEEFKTELDKIMEHINGGLEKVMQSIHDVVHEGLNVLGGLDHDKAFITQFDPDLFKNKMEKYQQQQAARRRNKEKTTTNSPKE